MQNESVCVEGEAKPSEAEQKKADDVQNEVFSNMSTSLRGSAGRLTRAARAGDKVAVLKVAGICVGAGVGAWVVLGWIF